MNVQQKVVNVLNAYAETNQHIRGNMAEINKTESNQFEKAGVNPFSSPTPGESLTQSPEQKFAWEQPARYTEVKPVMEEIFLEITDKENLLELIGLMMNKQPVDEIAQVILYKGATEGLFNMDLMLMLIEPTMYLLIAIAEEYDIEPILYENQDDDLIDKEEFAEAKKETLGKQVGEIKKDSVPSSLLERVKTLPSKEELGMEQ